MTNLDSLMNTKSKIIDALVKEFICNLGLASASRERREDDYIRAFRAVMFSQLGVRKCNMRIDEMLLKYVDSPKEFLAAEETSHLLALFDSERVLSERGIVNHPDYKYHHTIFQYLDFKILHEYDNLTGKPKGENV
jgi:hypothetical protein